MILLILTYILCALVLVLPVLVFVFGKQRGRLARALSADERDTARDMGGVHNPDLALRQTQTPVKACVAALFIAVFATIVIYLMTWLMGVMHISNFAQIMPSYAHIIAPASTLRESLDLIEADLEPSAGQEENPQARRRLQSIADRESVEFTDPDMAIRMLNFIKNERGRADDNGKKHTAAEAYAKFMLGWTGAEVSWGDNGQPAKSGQAILDEYESSIHSSIVPLSLKPMTYAQFAQRIAMINAARSLSQSTNADPQLIALQRSLYGRIVESVSTYARARQLFCGPIQFLTLTACYLSVILIAIRRERCLLQELAVNDALLDSWSNDTQLAASLVLRPGPPAENRRLIVELGVSPRNDALDREGEILARYMAMWTEGAPGAEPTFVPNLFAPSLAREVIDELSRTGGTLISAQELLNSNVERCETELERIEYSAIDYLVFAIPSLGFIGTVIGIGAALGSADSVVSASGREEQVRAVSDVTSVLGSAFDTTLIALVASLTVVAILSWVRSGESEMLRMVRHRIAEAYL